MLQQRNIFINFGCERFQRIPIKRLWTLKLHNNNENHIEGSRKLRCVNCRRWQYQSIFGRSEMSKDNCDMFRIGVAHSLAHAEPFIYASRTKNRRILHVLQLAAGVCLWIGYKIDRMCMGFLKCVLLNWRSGSMEWDLMFSCAGFWVFIASGPSSPSFTAIQYNAVVFVLCCICGCMQSTQYRLFVWLLLRLWLCVTSNQN